MKNIISYIALTLSLITFLFFFYKKENTVYVDSTKLFEEFTMTKELFKDFDKIIEVKKQMLDSLGNNLKNLEIDLKSKPKISKEEENRYYLLQQDFLQRQNQIEEEGKIILNENRNKIWARINEYTSVYGKDNNLQFIFGAKGDGNIMYAEKGKEITKELINFINEKYSGKHN